MSITDHNSPNLVIVSCNKYVHILAIKFTFKTIISCIIGKAFIGKFLLHLSFVAIHRNTEELCYILLCICH